MKISDSQKKLLLDLAKTAIESKFKNNTSRFELPLSTDKFLSQKLGVFVTLKKSGKLRGCIGYPEPIFPLGQAVVKAAIGAAFQDTRFSPLKQEELEDLKIEITILTKPEFIEVEKPEDYLNEIKIGQDGLVVERGPFSGLLLPQVATEHNFTPEQFLEHTCLKAGLHKDAWKNSDTKVFKFQGTVIE